MTAVKNALIFLAIMYAIAAWKDAHTSPAETAAANDPAFIAYCEAQEPADNGDGFQGYDMD